MPTLVLRGCRDRSSPATKVVAPSASQSASTKACSDHAHIRLAAARHDGRAEARPWASPELTNAPGHGCFMDMTPRGDTAGQLAPPPPPPKTPHPARSEERRAAKE